ncbi:MAG: hypothetical protein O6949_07745 [Chloroflexi bacterium]|nr:hypothetical protein [Chloroflexota bacterium]
MLVATRERIKVHLLQAGGLVDLSQRRDPDYATRVIAWLCRLEESLMQLRHPLAALVAAERGILLGVRDGVRDPQVAESTTSTRKITLATASVVLSRVVGALRSAIEEIDARFDAWREKMSQLLALASMEQAIPAPPQTGHDRWLRRVWEQVGQVGNAKGMHIYLSSVMAQPDRLYLLDELLGNLLSGDPTSEEAAAKGPGESPDQT